MKKNILLVEYDLATIETIKEILSGSVFDIAIAEEGETAKKLLSNKKFDLLITAAMLPKFHGFDLSKFVSEKYPVTKIIIISGVYKGVEYKSQAISEFHADNFLEKPIHREELLNSVLDLLNINESDFDSNDNKSVTHIPMADTKKIKTIKKEENEDSMLSSEDIFGDIIEKVEQSPHEISIEESEKHEDVKPGSKNEPGATQILNENYLIGETKIDEHPDRTYKEKEINYGDLLKTDLKTENKKTKKEIEDDISRKFDDTLSGLGLSVSKPKKDAIKKDIKAEPDKKKEKIPEESKKDGGDEIEGYEILDLIARGGMAEIYKAKKKGAKGFEKIIVIKKILSSYGDDDKYIEMFVDEAKIAAELSHSNIVQIYDFGKKDNYYFIAMEYIEGKDLRLILRELQKKNERLEEYLSIYIILKILEALSYAHSAKNTKGKPLEIVHRDISPPNILISYSGEVKLTDFGVSKASNKLHQTLSGALKGKLLYMSPEQSKAEKNVDNRSDIYSAGAILFELLTGSKLFEGASEMEVLNKVQEGKITPPKEILKDISPELEKIILTALERDRNKRFKNAFEMIKALESYIYKTYNYSATPIHLTNKIYELFKRDILKEGIINTPKAIPYEIEKLKVPEFKPETEPEKIDAEVIELKEEDKIEETKPADRQSPDSQVSEDIPPIPPEVENKKLNKPVKIEFETEDKNDDELMVTRLISEDFKRKKNIRPFFLVLFILTAIAAATYYFFFSDKDMSISLDKLPVVQTPVKKTEQKKDEIKSQISEDIDPLSEDKQDTIPENLITNGYKKNSDVSDPALYEKSLKPKDQQDIEKQKEEAKKIEIEKKKEEDRIKRERERVKKAAADKRKKKAEEEKRIKDEEERIRQEEEEKQKIALEEKRLEEERKRKEEELKKKIEEEKNRVKTGQLIALPDVDTKPEPVSTPAPKLTRSLRIKINQIILVSFLIDHFGNIEKVKLIRKSENIKIDDKIINTIKGWKYKPAVKDGVKVKVWKTIPINLKKS